jgi:hypothetical protein
VPAVAVGRVSIIGQIAGKIVVQLTAETAGIAAVDALIAFPAIVNVEQGFHPIAVLVPLDGAQIKLFVAKYPQRPQRGIHFILQQGQHRFCHPPSYMRGTRYHALTAVNYTPKR